MWHVPQSFFLGVYYMRRSKKHSIVEKHKYKVIGPAEEYYPETGLPLIRPKINFWKAAATLIVCVGLTTLFALLLNFAVGKLPSEYVLVKNETNRFWILYTVSLLLCFVICLKRILIFFIRVYQRYGPYTIRSRCVFIPNCSEYMILAINKYGLIKGVKKGIARFNRCHPPNGGEDYP